MPDAKHGILVNLMINDDKIGSTGISPPEVLQLGKDDMHAVSTIFCSVTLQVFHRTLAESKSNS